MLVEPTIVETTDSECGDKYAPPPPNPRSTVIDATPAPSADLVRNQSGRLLLNERHSGACLYGVENKDTRPGGGQRTVFQNCSCPSHRIPKMADPSALDIATTNSGTLIFESSSSRVSASWLLYSSGTGLPSSLDQLI